MSNPLLYLPFNILLKENSDGGPKFCHPKDCAFWDIDFKLVTKETKDTERTLDPKRFKWGEGGGETKPSSGKRISAYSL